MNKNRLIAEYHKKITDIEKLIEATKPKQTQPSISPEFDTLAAELSILHQASDLKKYRALRQAYIQIIKDIEDLQL